MPTRKDFYVYELIDPRTKKPFYVGKGCGDRYKDYYKSDPHTSTHTKLVIESIRADGEEVSVKLTQKDLTEDEALELESALIKNYGRITRDVNGILTNKFEKDRRKAKNKKAVQDEYATIQINRRVKDQVVDLCNKKGLKISRFVENLFLQAVSGSGGAYSGSISR